ncbi:hypothetical protein C8R45DRAFT_933938 [Mycena sanguinolenta]|nr:hypothetical protein C8R45DRAFT_933938 [Mycena sanguinolenta]
MSGESRARKVEEGGGEGKPAHFWMKPLAFLLGLYFDGMSRLEEWRPGGDAATDVGGLSNCDNIPLSSRGTCKVRGADGVGVVMCEADADAAIADGAASLVSSVKRRAQPASAQPNERNSRGRGRAHWVVGAGARERKDGVRGTRELWEIREAVPARVLLWDGGDDDGNDGGRWYRSKRWRVRNGDGLRREEVLGIERARAVEAAEGAPRPRQGSPKRETANAPYMTECIVAWMTMDAPGSYRNPPWALILFLDTAPGLGIVTAGTGNQADDAQSPKAHRDYQSRHRNAGLLCIVACASTPEGHPLTISRAHRKGKRKGEVFIFSSS